MKITFYRNSKVTDKEVNGIVHDVSFKQLVFNFKTPVILDITQDEFNELKASTDVEDNKKYLRLKDNGFFIGGEVDISKKSKRLEHVKNRTVLTFDIDKPTEDVYARAKSFLPKTQMLKYTTISHTPEKPRYRIMIPTSRALSSYEYVSVMNYMIDNLGRDSFDTTTTEVARVMFLPAVCKDGEYDFKYQYGDTLDVDNIITEVNINRPPIIDAMERQNIHPRERKGLVGAVNRAWTISEAIDEWLSDIYIKPGDFTEKSPRYRFHLSKGMPGATVYDDDGIMYSRHDTDPANSKRLDTFNLLKLHLHQDDYTKMREWAQRQSKVIKELTDVESPFNVETDEPLENWVEYLKVGKGAILDTPYNLQLILLNDPNLQHLFRINTLTYHIEVCRDMSCIGGRKGHINKTLEDADIQEVRIYLETCPTPVKASKQNVQDAVCQAARLVSYCPIKDYLESCENTWDEQPRVETIFTDYLMVADSEITRVIAKKVLAAVVWRVMKPGIKWEGVPVLWGPQGCGKTTFIQKLYKSSMFDPYPKNWINNTSVDYSQTDKAIQRTKGFWGIELAELANSTMSNYSNEQMKAFISADRPVTRIPYDKYEVTLDRKCIFWGTTNIWQYISDQTGSRRFIPLDCGAVTSQDKYECLKKIHNMPVDQIWAEVMTYYQHESLFFTPDEEEELQKLRETHTEESAYETILTKFLGTRIPTNWNEKTPLERREYFLLGGQETAPILRHTISMAEIMYEAIGRHVHEFTRKQMRELEVTLFNLGWTAHPYPSKTIYGTSKTYTTRRINNEAKRVE